MLETAKVTLYDVFGYLLPGMVMVAALAILVWAVHFPDEPLMLSLPGAEAWVIVLALAYMTGHMMQGLSNHLLTVLEWPGKRLREWKRAQSWQWFQRRRWFCSNEHIYLTEGARECLPAEFLSAARAKAAAMSGAPEKALEGEWLFRICDEAVVQRGNLGDREVFVYREAFYRGLTFALLGFAAALVVRMLRGETALVLAAGPRKVGSDVIAFCLVISLVFVYLSYRRYRRFGRYRISQAILAFLVMPEEKKRADEAEAIDADE